MLKFLALQICFICSLNAAGILSQVQHKADLLDFLKKEIQEDDDQDSKNDLKKEETKGIVDDVESAKTKLGLIRLELNKEQKDDKLLNELIEEFNKEIEDLKNRYKFLKSFDNEEQKVFKQSVSVSSIDCLKPVSEKKLMKRNLPNFDFSPIVIGDSLPSQNDLQNEKEHFPKE